MPGQNDSRYIQSCMMYHFDNGRFYVITLSLGHKILLNKTQGCTVLFTEAKRFIFSTRNSLTGKDQKGCVVL